MTDRALDVARDIFAKADEVVRQKTGSGIIATAFDMAAPAMVKQAPALAILLPIIRRIMLPMVEKALTAQEYTETVIAVQVLEDTLADLIAKAVAAQARIDAMTDDEIDQYLASNNMIRQEP